MFIGYCRATGLDPFKREIWCIKDEKKNRMLIMTGINGFFQIANSHPQFDGIACAVDDEQRPTRAVCEVYRKDRSRPSVGVALLSEFRRATSAWERLPRMMLLKVAKAIALREAFPQQLNGLYAEEEMPDKFEQSNVVVATTPQQAFNEVATPKERKPSQTEAQIKTLALIATKEAIKYDREKVGAALKSLSEKERKSLWNGLMKDFGAVNDGSFIFTSKPVPGWEKFIAADGKGQQIELDDAAFHAEVDAALRGAA